MHTVVTTPKVDVEDRRSCVMAGGRSVFVQR